MSNPSHVLSPEENFRIHGAVTQQQLEALLDSHRVVESVSSASAYIDDARAQFPDEGFLSEVINDLVAVTKGMRKGDRLTELEGAISKLREIEQSSYRATEEGRDLLLKLKKEIQQ